MVPSADIYRLTSLFALDVSMATKKSALMAMSGPH